jgi:hypothetical protein
MGVGQFTLVKSLIQHYIPSLGMHNNEKYRM